MSNRRRRAPSATAQDHADDPFLTANRHLVTHTHPDDALDPAKRSAGSRRQVTVNMREHVTSWLHHRGLLTDIQYAASEKLRADYERAQLGQRVTMDWNPAASRGRRHGGQAAMTPGLGQIDAKRSFRAALAAVGPGLADICWRIICAGDAMGEAEKTLGWPARSGRIVLTIALDRLAAHYGVDAGQARK